VAESEPKLNLTQTQEYIIARHSKMVGKVLDLIEASLPEGNQCDKLKKLLQVPLYDFRNEMIQLDAKGLPNTD
jgi:chemotaxis regulatin CheY-phosphate phosphatase CheZ|tara:strand:- start:148 stop:366 length:219 start_codon:yes stop_codon:yes gene_type:complete